QRLRLRRRREGARSRESTGSRHGLTIPAELPDAAACDERAAAFVSGSAKQVGDELRAHPARYEHNLVVRAQLAQPVEGTAIDQRDDRSVRCAHVDHEPKAVVVRVIETLMLKGRADA